MFSTKTTRLKKNDVQTEAVMDRRWLFVCCLACLPVTSLAMTEQKVRMCYYTSWAQYRHGKGRFLPSDIDPFLCTHLIYAFASIQPDTNSLEMADVNDADMYQQVLDHKAQNPRLRVLLAVGGATHGTEGFESVASAPNRSEQFAQNAIAFLRQHGFDGLDVDWEFPDEEGKLNFQTFLQIISVRFQEEAVRTGRRKLDLTLPVSGDPAMADTSYGARDVAQYVDYVLLMAYDLWGTWSLTLGHHSPLHVVIPGHVEQGRFSMARLVDQWVQSGAPRQKLVLGLSTYGRTGVMAAASLHHPGDPWARHMGTAGTYTRAIGYLAYFEMCDNLASTGTWNSSYSPTGQAPYAWQPDSRQYACYDDTASFEAKARYILDEGLAGAMFWALDFDDFSGSSCQEGPYPLLNKVKAILLSNATDDEEIRPSASSNSSTPSVNNQSAVVSTKASSLQTSPTTTTTANEPITNTTTTTTITSSTTSPETETQPATTKTTTATSDTTSTKIDVSPTISEGVTTTVNRRSSKPRHVYAPESNSWVLSPSVFCLVLTSLTSAGLYR